MGEMHTRITAMDLAAEMQVTPERVGQLFRAFRDGKHPHFAGRFNRFAELSPIQAAMLRGQDFEVVSQPVEDVQSEAVEPADIAMTPEAGQSNEVAPQGFDCEKLEVYTRWEVLKARHIERSKMASMPQKKTKTTLQKALLLSVCALCATASVSNMLDISMQIKGVFWAACVITAIFTLSPFAVFYAGVRAWVSWLVSGVCIGYEVFCNSVGIYRGLSGLGKGLPYEVWEPGGFIDSVSRVTTVGFKPCALGISFTMAGIIAGLFLVCLNELKK